MTNHKGAIIAALTVAGLATGYAFQSGQAWPPPLQPVNPDAPVLSPAESMKKIVLPPGYRLELVASEPMIQEPVAIDWDSNGRLWVIEMLGYMEDMPATSEMQPTGRVSVLEDTDNDGKMDKKTVFLDQLVLPRTLKVMEHGVLVAEPPHIWFAMDTNGDLKADSKEPVTDTYGQREANVEHNANSLMWALDNWMHTSEVDTIIRFKNGKFEVRKTLARGQWGAGMDDAGRVYRNTNQAALFVDIVPTLYYAKNPDMLRTRGSYETLDTGDLNTTWPIHQTPGVNRGYQDGVLRPDGTLAAFTSVAAPTVYRGDRLPKDLYGNVFVVEPAANLVSRIIVNDDGTMLRGKKAYERGEFIASTDERFRPVYLSSAPDGTLYVVDMYHGIIQHKGFITEYLRDQILSRKLDKPQGYGRIYRVVHETTKRDDKPALSKATSAQLVELLSHPNGWWRDTAQRMLVERGDKSVVKQLTGKAETASDWRTRLHALWILDGIDAITPATVIKALDDPSRDVRASAVRLAERWSAEASSPVQAALLKKVDDKDWAVRRQLAATLGTLPDSVAAKYTTLAGMLQQSGDDPMVVDAALTGLNGSEQKVLEKLFAAPAATPQTTAAITALAATIVKSGQDPRVQDVFKWTADSARPEWQRAALLDGAEAALLNRPLGGGGRRGAAPGAAAAAAGSGRGERGGPGGAPAFARPDAGAAGRAGGGRGRGNMAPVRLAGEPAALKQLAASGGDVGKRAEALLARLTWPGKPVEAGATPAAAPLTAAEQKRFEDGKTVYTTLCVACHNENGEGREKVAPALAGSNFATAAAHVPMRILINGKEGTTGLMPPLGTTLTDDQIAAVLTFVRRSWGNQAAAVDPAAVADIRKQTTGRTRPWTEKELLELAPR